MKTLYILRHAKSSWDDANLTDFERPLNLRGERAAPFMGKLMRERGLIPDRLISSPAIRARQTAELVRAAAKLEAEITHDQRIYEATAGTLIEVIGEIDEAYNATMIVGHNPGMEGLIHLLTGKIASMRTASLAVVELDVIAWNRIERQKGRLLSLFRPKELMPDK